MKEIKAAVLIPYICMFITDVFLEIVALMSAMEPRNKISELKNCLEQQNQPICFGSVDFVGCWFI